MYKYLICLFLGLSLSACASTLQDGAPNKTIDISKIKNPVPHTLKRSTSGNPDCYTVLGKTYHTLKTATGYRAIGYASWYGTKFNGQLTSSGEPYDMYKMTAANKVLPIPCYAKVTDLATHKSIIVKVNDRGPFKSGRIIDLSYAAALKLGIVKHGTARVEVAAIDPRENVINRGINTLSIQAGAFSNANNANQFAEKLKTDLNAKTIIKHNQHLSRVYVIDIANLEKALKIQNKLQCLGVKHPIILTNTTG